MKLNHWRKLYEKEATEALMNLTKEQLIAMLLSDWTIKHWKDFEKGQTQKGESS